jgi:hypothetical protein
MCQLGILPDLDTQGPANYSATSHNPLNRQVWLAIKDRGTRGASSKMIASQLGHPPKSIAGRCTELHREGFLRRTEARDGGVIYIAIGALL